MEKRYFVISLPRTGTSSLTKMAMECGMRSRHAPHSLWKRCIKDHDFLTDTPIFCPHVINEICKLKDYDTNFIYIERNYDEIFDSWKRVNLYKSYSNMKNNFHNPNHDKPIPFDFISYQSAFNGQHLSETNYKELFDIHKQTVFNIVHTNNRPLMIYNFSQGWEPFCSFIGKEQPCESLPHINKNRMLEKIL